ncbi:MAG: hypothetical protein BGO31_19120 [Bacteroidetes bacterium 43-16]|nr:MAG: hypothetical protein BGO31_19120 [Bacteroidetes bacterium 43-16]
MKIRIHPQIIGQQQDETPDDFSSSAIDVKNNWSYAVYLLVAGAVGGTLQVNGLDMFEDALEKRIFEALQDNACNLSIRAEFVRVKKGETRAFQFDIGPSPELYLPLIVLAARAKDTSVLSNFNTVIEHNPEQWQSRFDTLTRLGMELKLQDGLLIIKGGHHLKPSSIEAITDPALLAAIVLMGLSGDAPLTLHEAHLLEDLFPGMINDLNKILAVKIETLS